MIRGVRIALGTSASAWKKLNGLLLLMVACVYQLSHGSTPKLFCIGDVQWAMNFTAHITMHADADIGVKFALLLVCQTSTQLETSPEAEVAFAYQSDTFAVRCLCIGGAVAGTNGWQILTT
eukprot:TRINITY_DN42825_c0_g1_i1.p2 TRINITY_DN42825_c0_g1~~TRINITY_DN42825_c0_g1_i1.p2  ORF type:complete len:121 (-),score=10.85 TRINITY_DN42825_c0_g1_i1:421-783(-)